MPTINARRRAEDTALGRVQGTFADAAAHANVALTETLKATPEGRPTAAKVRRSRSYLAALNRLSELVDGLVALVETFRVETYDDAWQFWRRYLGEFDVLRPTTGDGPPQDLRERCRTAMIHGRTLRQDLKFAIDRAAKSLAPTLVVAGNRATAAKDATQLVKRWADGAASTVSKVAALALNDSLTMSDRLAGRDVILPELLEPDPTLPFSEAS